VKSRSNTTGLIKQKVRKKSKIVIVRILSMDIFYLPAFFQNKKRCCLVTLPFLTSALPLPPSNALFTGFCFSMWLLFSVFFLFQALGICLFISTKKLKLNSAEGLKHQKI